MNEFQENTVESVETKISTVKSKITNVDTNITTLENKIADLERRIGEKDYGIYDSKTSALEAVKVKESEKAALIQERFSLIQLKAALINEKTALTNNENSDKIQSKTYKDADLEFIADATEVPVRLETWENIPVDESIIPSLEFVELYKKTCSVFEFSSEASKRMIIDLFLREIVSKFPPFQLICDYHMILVNEANRHRLNGKSDYTLCHRGQRNLPLLATVSAQYTNHETMRLCFGASASIHYFRKKSGMHNCVVYGIHSTGNLWNFIFVNQLGVIHVSLDKQLNLEIFNESSLYSIYRHVYYVVQQTFLNNPHE